MRRLAALALAAALAALAPERPALADPEPSPQGPDFSPGPREYPDADALILRWEQRFTVEPDGAVDRREHRWVKILSERAIDQYGDPRIDFEEGTDEVRIHVARTHLPDGTVLPVPDYGFNLAAPDDVGGWPAWAAWRQRIVTFSGIEPGAILELDLEVRTQPGAHPWLSADLRLDADDPVLAREVTVSVPAGTPLHHRLTRSAAAFEKTTAGGRDVYRWAAGPTPAGRDEAQSLPWEERCPRLRITTCPGAAAWVRRTAGAADAAARVDPDVEAFAKGAAGDGTDLRERIEKIVGRLRATFQLVDSPRTRRGHLVRFAPTVLASGCGSSLEAAALLAASLRALGLEARVLAAVDPRTWDAEVPVDEGLVACVVRAALPNGPVLVHPREGILRSPGAWGPALVLDLDGEGNVVTTPIERRGDGLVSEIGVTGAVEVTADGKLRGSLTFRLTGLFLDPGALRTEADQRRLVEGLAHRLLGGAKVTGHAVLHLSDDALEVRADLEPAPLPAVAGGHLISLGEPMLLAEVPLPLDRSDRRTAVRARGAVRETVDLVVSLAEGREAAVLPAALPEAKGEFGRVVQDVETTPGRIRIRREVEISSDTIEAPAFGAPRDAVNALRTTGSRLLLVRPAGR